MRLRFKLDQLDWVSVGVRENTEPSEILMDWFHHHRHTLRLELLYEASDVAHLKPEGATQAWRDFAVLRFRMQTKRDVASAK
jgi:hypothetical protein